MLPLCRTVQDAWEKKGYLVGKLAERLGAAAEDILSFELCAYCDEKAQAVGFEEDFLSSPRLDNLTSVHALRQYSLCYLILGVNILIGGFLTAVERPRPAICISVGRGLVLQAGALMVLAFTVGGSSIWFAPLISELLCLALSQKCLRNFLKSPL